MTKPEHPGRAAVRRLVEQARTIQGITKEELAKSAQISTKTLYNFQAGDRWPHPRALRGLERALGFTPLSLDDVLEHDTPESVTIEHLTGPGSLAAPVADPSQLSDKDLLWELTERLQSRAADARRWENEAESLRALLDEQRRRENGPDNVQGR